MGWEPAAEGLALFVEAVAGTEVEEGAGGTSGRPGTAGGFSGLRDSLSVLNSCIKEVATDELSVKTMVRLFLVSTDSGC